MDSLQIRKEVQNFLEASEILLSPALLQPALTSEECLLIADYVMNLANPNTPWAASLCSPHVRTNIPPSTLETVAKVGQVSTHPGQHSCRAHRHPQRPVTIPLDTQAIAQSINRPPFQSHAFQQPLPSGSNTWSTVSRSHHCTSRTRPWGRWSPLP